MGEQIGPERHRVHSAVQEPESSQKRLESLPCLARVRRPPAGVSSTTLEPDNPGF